MQFFLVSDYIAETRIMMQDTVAPYRYTDDTLLSGLNSAMGEISRLRPDILMDAKYQTRLPSVHSIGDNIPYAFTVNNTSAVVGIPPQYKQAVLFYMAGITQLIDTEDDTDNRAQTFLTKFTAAMATIS